MSCHHKSYRNCPINYTYTALQMYNLHYTAVIKLCWLPTLNITLTRLDFDLNSDTTVENVADP